ncbi:hypothetical protein ACTA71_002242 [Dictyostelium dimigraforme]
MKLLLSVIFLIFSISSVFSQNATMLITPYKDSNCKNSGGGVGYGYVTEAAYANLIQQFGDFNDVVLFTQSTDGNQLKMSVLSADGSPLSVEVLTLGQCSYSKYFNNYFIAALNADLPSPSIQFNYMADESSFGSDCSVEVKDSFAFVTNGTTVNISNDENAIVETQQFTCVNDVPFLKVCRGKSCKTSEITSCFENQSYQATCVN